MSVFLYSCLSNASCTSHLFCSVLSCVACLAVRYLISGMISVGGGGGGNQKNFFFFFCVVVS